MAAPSTAGGDGLPLPYLGGYAPALLAQVRQLIANGQLAPMLARRYPDAHDVRTDGALYAHVQALKARHMRQSGPLAKVQYDPRLQLVHQALGTHTTVARVQGGQLKAKREIRVASLFKDAPRAFLDMIVVHELAHLKHRDHDKAFYALCCHMLPDYHQVEFDLRLWLTLRAQPATAALAGRADVAGASPCQRAGAGDSASAGEGESHGASEGASTRASTPPDPAAG